MSIRTTTPAGRFGRIEEPGDRDGTLAFEAEFDGIRRPQPMGEELCDPSRYWDIFSSGTD
jgi:hypothetical protein